MSRPPHFSIVIPFLNEEEALPQLRERLCGLAEMPEHTEFVLVSDGSSDRSVEIVTDWATEDPRVKLLVLTRNFGHQCALSAGLGYAKGDWVGVIDADLQDSPEALLEMLKLAETASADVVYAIRTNRKEGLIKRLAYAAFYKTYSFLADTPTQIDSGDFCIMKRAFLDKLLALPESIRFVRGLRSWIGMKQIGMHVERAERAGGQPQYSFRALITLALSGLTSFSTKPLRISSFLGVALCVASIITGLLYLCLALFTQLTQEVPGFASIVLILFFLHGLNFLIIGIVGEYLAQIFLEIKRRPTYLIDRVVANEHDETPRGEGT